MKLIKLKINTKTQKYSIIIGSNLVANVSKILKKIQLILNNVYSLLTKISLSNLFQR